MNWPVYILLALCLGIGIVSSVMCAKSLRKFTSRPCAGRMWRERFPNAGKDDIRNFLRFVDNAFGLRWKAYLSLRPDDRIMDIYHAIHPPKWAVGDCMDIESLIIDCKNQYNFELQSIWREDITLEDLFEAVTQAESSGTPA